MDGVEDQEALGDGLAVLMRRQLPFLVDLGHNNVEPDTLARYAAALMIEFAEFSNELPWKVWRREEPDPQLMRARILDEWSDCLSFLGTFQCLLWHFDISPEEAAAAFLEKNAENNQRRRELMEERGRGALKA